MTAITDWNDDDWFLNNSYETVIIYEGVLYPSVTHAFMGAQTRSGDLKKRIASLPLAALPSMVNLIGDLPDNFNGPDCMRKLLEMKFGYSQILTQMTVSQVELAERLIATGQKDLSFTNQECNTFWGKCVCPKHKGTKSHDILGGLMKGVRRRLTESVTQNVARDQTCSCEKVAEAFFLWALNGKLWLKPFCAEHTGAVAKTILNGIQGGGIYRFEKSWFPTSKQQAPSQKKQAPILPFGRAGLHSMWSDPHLVDKWRKEVWKAEPEPEKPELPQSIVFYLSGRIS